MLLILIGFGSNGSKGPEAGTQDRAISLDRTGISTGRKAINIAPPMD